MLTLDAIAAGLIWSYALKCTSLHWHLYFKLWWFFDITLMILKVPNIWIQYIINQREMLQITHNVVEKIHRDASKPEA
jgi:hypothetical protein